MKVHLPTRLRPQPSEDGYILIAVIFMLAILIIAMAVAAPKIRAELQRDREIETIHRGKQYSRAVKLYYKKFGTYPASVDALINTNQIRFLRKKYIDPTTGKEEWKAIRFGQQKTQSTGFFGQPIAGAGVPGGGLGGVNELPGASPIGGANPLNDNSSTSSNSNISTFGSTDQGSNPTPQAGTSGSTTDLSSGQTGGTQSGGTGTGFGSGSAFGTPGGQTGTGVGSGSAFGTPGGQTGTGFGSGSAFGTPGGQTGTTFGGTGIIGFSPTSPKQSILVFRKKNHYNEWEFIYDPLADQMMMQGGNLGTIGQPASGTTTPVGGSPGIGSGSGFGNSSGFGNNPGFGTPGGTNPGGSTPPPQPPPQQ